MASQPTENKRKDISSNLSKISKKKKKRIAALKHCDPGGVVNSYKKKKNRKTKHKSKEKLEKSRLVKETISNSAQSSSLPNQETISSNWKNLLKNLPAEDEGPKQKPAFVRRNKNGQLITNQHINHPKAVQVGLKKKKVKSVNIKENNDVWFDDVDPILLDNDGVIADKPNDTSNALVKTHGFTGVTKILGMDCEMVGIGIGGTDSMLARVSIVNHFGHAVYDTFVAPREKVTDYRTAVSGVRQEDLKDAPAFQKVQKEVSELLKGRLLVGHAIKHDLKVLYLDHPKKMIRDTSKYKPFRTAFGGRTPSLKNLAERFLGVKVQTGEHSSVQDSQAAVRLYTMFKKEWEAQRIAKKKETTSKPAVNIKISPIKTTTLKSDSGDQKRALYCPSDSDDD